MGRRAGLFKSDRKRHFWTKKQVFRPIMAAKWKILKTDKLFLIIAWFRSPVQNISFITVTSSEIQTTFTFEVFLPEPEKKYFPFKSRATSGKKNFSFWEQRTTLRSTPESLRPGHTNLANPYRISILHPVY